MCVRGYEADIKSFLNKKRIRDNRNPRNTDREIHEILVNAFSDNGFEANRHNSLFVSGKIAPITHYGNIYLIFPIGDISYTWSKYIDDLTMALELDHLIDWFDNGVFSVTSVVNDDEMNSLRAAPFKDLALYGAYPIEIDFNEGAFRDWINDNYINNENLDEALLSGHEVAITSDSGSYYFVPHPPKNSQPSTKLLKALGLR